MGHAQRHITNTTCYVISWQHYGCWEHTTSSSKRTCVMNQFKANRQHQQLAWKGAFQRRCMYVGIIQILLASLLCRLTMAPTPRALRASTPSLMDFWYKLSNSPVCKDNTADKTQHLSRTKVTVQKQPLYVNRGGSRFEGAFKPLSVQVRLNCWLTRIQQVT